MTENPTTCPKCAAPVAPPRPGGGRPPIYCGATCRALAGYEVRRLQRLLERLEGGRSLLRNRPVNTRLNPFQEGHAEAQRVVDLAAVEVEIVEAESRLRGLISEPRGRPLALPHETEAQNE